MASEYQSLASDLKKVLRGEVRFDDGSRALYAADASNYRQIPIGVVIPKDTEDVLKTLEICRRYGAPVLTRGAGTSLAGQCCNVAVIIDFSRHLNQILEINPQKKTARVQPGVVLDRLREAALPYGLTFGPDPATHSRCTLGGMIGNNACGVHSLMAGKMADNTESLEIVTYEGARFKTGRVENDELEKILRGGSGRTEIYQKLKALSNKYADLIRAKTPKLPRRVSGYNLEQLLPENGFQVARALVGTEGTCVTVLEAEVKLIENPRATTLAVLGYPDIFTAGDHVPEILKFKPIGAEGLDSFYVRNMKKSGLHLKEIADLPAGNSWLFVEFGGGNQAEADEKARVMIDALKPSAKIFRERAEQKRIWGLREASFGASVFVPGEKDTFSGFEDSAVPPEKLGGYLRELQKLYEYYDYDAITYGHFGDGCIHTRISFDLKTDPGIQKYKRFLEDASDTVVKFGGSFSGEHGDGQTWGRLLHKMYGPEMVQAFREFKNIWDPQNKMNPGKVVNSYAVDENLRLKEYSKISSGPLHFSYQEDGGDFTRTTERCIGIGKCLKTDEGIMCPSYMATREEKHSTRGRAHLLHEMMRGEVIKDGWQSEAVKEALDLCLACKGCKNECPVKVDMASYKAEFLAHYYKTKERPVQAYLFGMIATWASIASKIPWLANLLTQIPGINFLAKKILNVAPARSLPKFAEQSFRSWFESRVPSKKSSRATVILWPDTFSNYFYPEIAKAAVEVLEYAGFRIRLPAEDQCCGRPLYDYGMLDLAKDYLRKIQDSLKADLEAGAFIVGLEPSCIAVFQDELPQFFPENDTARRLKEQSFFFAEFVEKKIAGFDWPKLGGKAIVQGHCHQQSLKGMESDRKIFGKLGLDYCILDSGCCGMAGGFGFEKDHYEVSVKTAERVLLPEIQKAGKNTMILADGFSCREQISQLGGRRAFHLAEIMKMAIDKNHV